MENRNIIPSKDSSSPKNNSPPPSDDTHTTINDEGFIMKTPWQVLEELHWSSDDDDDGGGNNDNVRGETVVAMAVSTAIVGGDSTVVEGVVAAPQSEEMTVKKRKISIVRDPPSGKPICPVCNKEFASWKAAFGHMRAHPDRAYRGFFKPPVFTSSPSIQDEPPTEGDSSNNSVDEDNRGERVLAFDLNEPLPMEEGGSSHGVKPAEENNVVEEGNGSRLDLNEVPHAED